MSRRNGVIGTNCRSLYVSLDQACTELVRAMRHSTIFVAIGSLLVAGCRSPSDDARSTAVLLGSDDRIGADTIELVLAGLQRDLLSAVVTTDTAALSRLISADFKSHDVRVSEPTPMSVDGAKRPQQRAYLEVLAGGLSDHVAHEYRTFHVISDGGSATVYTFGADHAIHTVWRYRSRRWQASQMILLRPEDARTMMDLAQDLAQ
jgi:hypothetical protein